jgi:hypothetical protein
MGEMREEPGTEGRPGRRRFALALALALIAIALAAGLAHSQPARGEAGGSAARPQAGVALPHARGVRVPLSRILARSRVGRRPATAPTPGIEPGRWPGRKTGRATDTGPAEARIAAGPRARAVTLGTSFLGAQISDTPGFVPPDSMGAVGPSQVVVAVNGRLKVFDKSGNPRFDIDMDAFFAPVSEGSGTSDPHVRYDRLSKRWFIVMINLTQPSNKVLIAVSSGPTISNQSSFTFFSFGNPALNNTLSADYPTLGVDRFALYIGTNDFTSSGQAVSTTGFVVRKSALLNSSLVGTAFQLATAASPGPLTPQGAQNDDPTSSAGYFIGVDSEEFSKLDLRRVSNPGGTPTISGNLAIPVPETDYPIGVPAQGTSSSLDALDDRLFAAMIAKDPVTGSPRLWTAHNIEVSAAGDASGSGGRDGSRWYEIGSLNVTPTVVQFGTVFDASTSNPASYWMPSIAANGPGQAVLGASVAGVGRFAGIAATQRFRSDPLGTMSTPVTVQPGLAPYDLPQPPPALPTDPQRWGDFSQTVVDPNDQMTFWTFQEYANATNSWGVRALQIRAAPPAKPSAAAPARIPFGKRSVNLRITGISSGGSAFFDPGPDTGGPGFAKHIAARVGGGVKVRRVLFIDATHLTLDLDTRRAGPGAKNVTITNPDGQRASATGLFTIVDRSPPQTRISGPRVTADPTPTFSFRSNEPGSRFKCKLDRDRFRGCRSPKTLPELEPGQHVFRVKAVDRAGNVDPTAARRRFTILP